MGEGIKSVTNVKTTAKVHEPLEELPLSTGKRVSGVLVAKRGYTHESVEDGKDENSDVSDKEVGGVPVTREEEGVSCGCLCQCVERKERELTAAHH